MKTIIKLHKALTVITTIAILIDKMKENKDKIDKE